MNTRIIKAHSGGLKHACLILTDHPIPRDSGVGVGCSFGYGLDFSSGHRIEFQFYIGRYVIRITDKFIDFSRNFGMGLGG